jgi:uncharacterized protein (UPF0210 family)
MNKRKGSVSPKSRSDAQKGVLLVSSRVSVTPDKLVVVKLWRVCFRDIRLPGRK